MTRYITASMLYDWCLCPHRVSLDLFGDPAERDGISLFVKMLWEKGNEFEKKVVDGVGAPFTDLSTYAGEEKEAETLKAMERGDPLIYSSRIRHGNLLGMPDLLRRERGGYVAGDIKSGAGLEGGSDIEDGKPKKHYAVQLGLYTDILERRGLLASRQPFIWDVHGEELVYDLDAALSARHPVPLWEDYLDTRARVEEAVARKGGTVPALSSTCKLCHWHSHCLKQVERTDDLTLIPELGRSRRDVIHPHVKTVAAMATADLSPFLKGGKTVFPRIGSALLNSFQMRARLLKDPDARPVLTASLDLPAADREIFFDVETDPMRDRCYLHGFLVRTGRDRATETYIAFFADDPTDEAEKDVFAAALDFLKNSRPFVMYFFSKYERTQWRRLQEKYPDAATVEEIEAWFDPETAVDLYNNVVLKKTEWPTYSKSIKTLARYLGFEWRDTDPSGASSIEWYHRWVESRDRAIKQRILDYNEDDCRATRVWLDGLREMDGSSK